MTEASGEMRYGRCDMGDWYDGRYCWEVERCVFVSVSMLSNKL